MADLDGVQELHMILAEDTGELSKLPKLMYVGDVPISSTELLRRLRDEADVTLGQRRTRRWIGSPFFRSFS